MLADFQNSFRLGFSIKFAIRIQMTYKAAI